MRAGIDLGTTNSLIARLHPDGTSIIIPDNNFRQFQYTPSSVYLGDGTALVGMMAEMRLDQDPTALINRFFKRSFGKLAPLSIDKNGNEWYAESLAALVLKKLVNDYQQQTGEQLQEVVITIPAHFNDKQRKAVIYAANMANIPLKGLLEEPYAAALHYGVQVTTNQKSVIFVYDLGGGTFDASVISLTPSKFEVLAKSGDSSIGGKEFDEVIMKKIRESMGIAPEDLNAFQLIQLRRAAEKIKKILSEPDKTFIQEQIVIGNWSSNILFSRLEFEQQIESYLLKTIKICKRCIHESGLQMEHIDHFLLVGGSSQIPYIKKLLLREFACTEDKIKVHFPMRAIAYGAALHTLQLSGDTRNERLPPEFKGVTGFNIGIRTINPQTGKLDIDTLVYKNQPLPARANRLYYTTDAQQNTITLEIVQYLENSNQAENVGVLQVGPIPNPRANYMMEVQIENTTNGTIEVNAYDPQTGNQVKHTFTNRTEESVFMLQQKALVQGILVNNI